MANFASNHGKTGISIGLSISCIDRVGCRFVHHSHRFHSSVALTKHGLLDGSWLGVAMCVCCTLRLFSIHIERSRLHLMSLIYVVCIRGAVLQISFAANDAWKQFGCKYIVHLVIFPFQTIVFGSCTASLSQELRMSHIQLRSWHLSDSHSIDG